MSRYRLPIFNSLLLLTLLAGLLGRHLENAARTGPDFLRPLALPFANWTTTEVALTPTEQQQLEPDAVLIRRYRSPQGEQAELAVIAGHRKKTIHTPGFCMAGSGWDTLWKQERTLTLPDRRVVAMEALLSHEGQRLLVTYFFTNGDYSTPSLLQFQGRQILTRLQEQVPLGALVRVIVPLHGSEAAAQQRRDEFIRATLPPVLDSLCRSRQSGNARPE